MAFSSPTAYVPLNGTYVEPGFTVTVGGQAVSDPASATTVDTAVAGVQRRACGRARGRAGDGRAVVVVGAPSFPISYMSPTAMRAGPEGWAARHPGKGCGIRDPVFEPNRAAEPADDVMSVNFTACCPFQDGRFAGGADGG